MSFSLFRDESNTVLLGPEVRPRIVRPNIIEPLLAVRSSKSGRISTMQAELLVVVFLQVQFFVETDDCVISSGRRNLARRRTSFVTITNKELPFIGRALECV